MPCCCCSAVVAVAVAAASIAENLQQAAATAAADIAVARSPRAGFGLGQQLSENFQRFQLQLQLRCRFRLCEAYYLHFIITLAK